MRESVGGDRAIRVRSVPYRRPVGTGPPLARRVCLIELFDARVSGGSLDAAPG